MKAATYYCRSRKLPFRISIHAAREGGDRLSLSTSIHVTIFQSTPPVKAATAVNNRNAAYSPISIHAAREGGDYIAGQDEMSDTISIHAAREGGDRLVNNKIYTNRISIHAAREGGDPIIHMWLTPMGLFQSTPPVKAATLQEIYAKSVPSISIHAAREGGDHSLQCATHSQANFNPRRP